MHIFVIGNAASGKTTLSLRLKERGFRLVNLDPSTGLPKRILMVVIVSRWRKSRKNMV